MDGTNHKNNSKIWYMLCRRYIQLKQNTRRATIEGTIKQPVNSVTKDNLSNTNQTVEFELHIGTSSNHTNLLEVLLLFYYRKPMEMQFQGRNLYKINQHVIHNFVTETCMFKTYWLFNKVLLKLNHLRIINTHLPYQPLKNSIIQYDFHGAILNKIKTTNI